MKSDSATKVAIVGSGPYGLSLASHLSHRKLEHRIFGSPMQTWRNMLPDIGLKSLGWATNIYAPQKGFKFADYCRAHGKTLEEPIAMTLFAAYGLWAQQRLVPELETSHVSRVELADRGFQVTLETGERLLARRVVMATGLAHYHQIPEVFSGLPEGLVSHTSEHSDVSGFRGKDVTVIGAGASALEAATLL